MSTPASLQEEVSSTNAEFLDTLMRLESQTSLIRLAAREPGDRFIPFRTAHSTQDFIQDLETTDVETSLPVKGVPASLLKKVLLESGGASLLGFSKPKPRPQYEQYSSSLELLLGDDVMGFATRPRKQPSVVSIKRKLILEAQGLLNDFYLNLVSWSAINCFYTAVHQEGNSLICGTKLESDCSIKEFWNFAPVGTNHLISVKSFATHYILAGCENNEILIYDGSQKDSEPISRYSMSLPSFPRTQGVGAIETMNQNTFASISFNGGFGLFDKRQTSNVMQINLLEDEHLEFSQLKPSRLMNIKYNGQHQMVVSSNRSSFFHFDARYLSRPVRIVEEDYHLVPGVKAIAFNDKKPNMLISGGGLDSKDLVLRDIRDNRLLSRFDTGHQISNICWLQSNIFIVSYGFTRAGLAIFKLRRDNQIELLRTYCSNLSTRFIYMDSYKNRVVVGTADETIKLFEIKNFETKTTCPMTPMDFLNEYGLTMR